MTRLLTLALVALLVAVVLVGRSAAGYEARSWTPIAVEPECTLTLDQRAYARSAIGLLYAHVDDTDALTRYVYAVACDGDHLNDWLTHFDLDPAWRCTGCVYPAGDPRGVSGSWLTAGDGAAREWAAGFGLTVAEVFQSRGWYGTKGVSP